MRQLCNCTLVRGLVQGPPMAGMPRWHPVSRLQTLLPRCSRTAGAMLSPQCSATYLISATASEWPCCSMMVYGCACPGIMGAQDTAAHAFSVATS